MLRLFLHPFFPQQKRSFSRLLALVTMHLLLGLLFFPLLMTFLSAITNIRRIIAYPQGFYSSLKHIPDTVLLLFHYVQLIMIGFILLCGYYHYKVVRKTNFFSLDKDRRNIGGSFFVTLALGFGIYAVYLMGYSKLSRCLIQQRNVQQAVRSYQGLNGFMNGSPIHWEDLHKADFVSQKPPHCPYGDPYIFEKNVPPNGVLYMRCRNPKHKPNDYSSW